MKNKKNKLKIEWPKSHFTIKNIQDKYPSAKNITLRFRINRAIEDGLITYIGKNETSVGRPTIVFAPCPVDSGTLADAVNSGVILDEKFAPKVVTVARVNTEPTSTSKTVPDAVKTTA